MTTMTTRAIRKIGAWLPISKEDPMTSRCTLTAGHVSDVGWYAEAIDFSYTMVPALLSFDPAASGPRAPVMGLAHGMAGPGRQRASESTRLDCAGMFLQRTVADCGDS